MAKIKHSDFLDKVDDVISHATNAGILHLAVKGASYGEGL